MTAIATDWLGLRAAVISAASAALPPSVLATTAVEWADGPRSTARRHVLLSVVSATFDDRDSALDTGGPQRLESMATVVVQLSAEAIDDAGDADALWLIEQLRLGLRKVSVRAALQALGIAIQVFPRSTRNIGGVVDGRALSVHAIEATFCATFVLETGEDAGLVEHVELEATVTDDRGDELALELTVDDPSPEPP